MTAGVVNLRSDKSGVARLASPTPDTGVVGSGASRTLADRSGQTDAQISVPQIRVATLGEGFVVGYLSVPDAAKFLDMGTTFVEDRIASGELSSYKFGRSRKLRVLDLERWASRQKESA